MVDQEIIDQIKTSTDIIELISDYVMLKKRGQNFLGLCPFHGEKTPSFTVSPAKSIFHCFGCGEGGNIFSFLMKIENISFPESLAVLAEKAGIEIEASQFTAKKDTSYDYQLKILEIANDYYKSQRKSTDSLSYIKERGLSGEILQDFAIGYAPKSSKELLSMLQKDFKSKDLEESGIFFETSYGLKSRFESRLMFPIVDIRSRVIGFGGRIIGEGDPKYLNSPETKIYHKSEQLYSLNVAKKYCREKGHIILVEGYMDVVALYQQGFKETVACLGTSFTSQHAKLVARHTKVLFLCFDSDKAGRRAVAKAFQSISGCDLDVKVIDLGESKDPDDYFKVATADDFKKKMADALPVRRFVINEIIGSFSDGGNVSIEDKERIVKEVKSFMSSDDEITKSEYLTYLADKINVDVEMVKSSFYSYRIMDVSERPYLKKNTKIDKYSRLERDVLVVLLQNKLLRDSYFNKFDGLLFEDEINKEIFSMLDKNKALPIEDIINLDKIEHKKLITELSLIESNPDAHKILLDEALVTFSRRGTNRRKQELKQEIKELEKSGNFDKLTQLQKEYQSLVKNIAVE